MSTIPLLHLFRRDLRLIDNTALDAALQTNNPLSFGFIFDPRQVSDKNGYKSLFALRFLCESLQELSKEISHAGGTLNIWYGNPGTIVKQLVQEKQIAGLSINADYTPFSMHRDQEFADICTKNNLLFIHKDDALLTIPGSIRTGNGQPFKIFTPFYKAAQKCDIAVPTPESTFKNMHPIRLPQAHQVVPEHITAQYASLPASSVASGRRAGRAILDKLDCYTDYINARNIPSQHGTTRLSAHHKFGTLSIREVYHQMHTKLGSAGEPLIRQLYWRDFFTHVATAFPHVFGSAFQEKYNHIEWKNDIKMFERWCTGTTGFPIVDAGMRELNETGYMHNRARMITASFLVKDLHIDWRWGERYFAQHLIDYDPCVNNGSWQWAASTGCDAQPYFRIFNPWLQQKRFDPDAIYIKKWVPELQRVRSTALHTLDTKPLSLPNYPAPMVDHRIVSKQAKDMFAAM